MIIIYPNPKHRLIDMRDWCEDQFGIRDRKTWSIMLPEFMFMFAQEDLAVTFLLRFGGKIYERQNSPTY